MGLPHVLCLSFLGAWVPPLTLFLRNWVRARDVGCQEAMSEAIFDSKSLLIYVQFHYTYMNYDFEPKHQGNFFALLYVPLVFRFSLASATHTSTMSKCAGMALDLPFAGTKGVARR